MRVVRVSLPGPKGPRPSWIGVVDVIYISCSRGQHCNSIDGILGHLATTTVVQSLRSGKLGESRVPGYGGTRITLAAGRTTLQAGALGCTIVGAENESPAGCRPWVAGSILPSSDGISTDPEYWAFITPWPPCRGGRRPYGSHDLVSQSSIRAPESLFSASDDSRVGGGLGGPLMAFWHPTLSPGRCRKTCASLVCWLVLISYIFCYLTKGAGVNPVRHRRGFRVI